MSLVSPGLHAGVTLMWSWRLPGDIAHSFVQQRPGPGMAVCAPRVPVPVPTPDLLAWGWLTAPRASLTDSSVGGP